MLVTNILLFSLKLVMIGVVSKTNKENFETAYDVISITNLFATLTYVLYILYLQIKNFYIGIKIKKEKNQI